MDSFDVTILGGLGENVGNLRSEVSKVKASLLYGDQILVKSHKIPFLLSRMGAIARLLPQRAMEAGFSLNRSMSEELIAKLEDRGIHPSHPTGALIFEVLRSEDPSAILHFNEALAEMLRERNETTGLDGARYFQATAAVSVENYFRSNEDPSKNDALVAVSEMVQLNESRIVTVDTADSQRIAMSELDDVENAFANSLQKALDTFTANRLDHPLLISGAQLKINDAAHTDHEAEIRYARANRAELAASMIADIPAFPNASVDEILDIRDRVSDQLGRFRAAVADLECELNTDIDNKDFVTEVEDLKLRKVVPVMDELKESLRDQGIGPTVARSVPVMASGALGLGASVAIGAPDLAGVIAVSAGATTAVAKEVVERTRQDRERKKHRLFLLFDVSRRLSEKRPGRR